MSAEEIGPSAITRARCGVSASSSTADSISADTPRAKPGGTPRAQAMPNDSARPKPRLGSTGWNVTPLMARYSGLGSLSPSAG